MIKFAMLFFGNSYAAVNTAANWTNVGSEIFASAYDSPNLSIPDNNLTGVSDTINITQNIGIEFVEINFTAADHTYWGDLEIELISPSGTSSILAKSHNVDNSTQRYDNWTFGSVRYLGETSQGTWRLNVKDLSSGDTGTFQKWGLRIYGNQFLPGWSSRKLKNITGTTAGAQTNYQMKLTVYKGSGTDTPGVVYLGGNVRDDFGDLRFTKSDGVTLLDYWIESYSSGASAVVWVEVDYIPASPNNASIYLYYGNPSAASASSGTNTFVFFDDFENYITGNLVGQLGWTYLFGNSNEWQIQTIQKHSGNEAIGVTTTYDGDRVSKSMPNNNNLELNLWTMLNSSTRNWLVWLRESSNGRVAIRSDNNLISGRFGYYKGSTASDLVDTGITPTLGAWYKWRVVLYSNSTADYYIYNSVGTMLFSATNKGVYTNMVSGVDNIALNAGNPTSTEYFDDFYIRKYASPEPTWA